MNNIHNLNFIIHHLTKKFYENHLLKASKINIEIGIKDLGLTIVKEQKKFAYELYGFLWIKLYGVQIELIKCDFFFVFVYDEMDMEKKWVH